MQDEFHSGTKLVPKVTPVSRKQRVISCFVEDVNMVRRSLLSLSERGYGCWEFGFGRVRLH